MHCTKIKTKSGQVRWECVADGPRDPATGKRNQITRRAKTQKEAKQKVLNVIAHQDTTGNNKIEKITFEIAAQRWYDAYKMTGKKDSTLLRRRKELKVLNEQMAKHPINKITHYMYQRTINKLFKIYAENTLNGIHDCANQIFKYAKRNKWIQENPATDIIKPKRRKTIDEIKQDNIEEKYLNQEELEEFLSAAAKYGLRYDKERFYTLAFSGMRPGELCSLQKSDLLFDTNEIDINKTLYSESNNMKDYQLTTPKSDGSVRTINMDEKVMAMLKKVVLNNDKHKMKYRHLDDFHDMDFVFSRENGYPFNTIPLNVRMNRLLKKTFIKKDATPHIFRHTHISMLTEAGVDISTIMKRVGHDDMETTMKIYTHVTDKMKKDAPVKMSNLYGNIIEKISF